MLRASSVPPTVVAALVALTLLARPDRALADPPRRASALGSASASRSAWRVPPVRRAVVLRREGGALARAGQGIAARARLRAVALRRFGSGLQRRLFSARMARVVAARRGGGRVLQDTGDPAQLLRDAAVVHPRLEHLASDLAARHGGVVHRAPGGLKTEQSLREQIARNYGGDGRRSIDVSRITVALPRAAMYLAAEQIVQGAAAGGYEVVAWDDWFVAPPRDTGGYGHLALLVRFPLPNGGGHVTELQLNTPEMVAAKIEGHRFFEVARAMPPPDRRTPEQQREHDRVFSRGRELYVNARRAERQGSGRARPRARRASNARVGANAPPAAARPSSTEERSP